MTFFAEIWLEAVEPFISPDLTPGARRALVLDSGEEVLWKQDYAYFLEWRAEPGHEARHAGNNGPICFPKLLALWTFLEKSRITSHFCGLGLALGCPLDVQPGDPSDSLWGWSWWLLTLPCLGFPSDRRAPVKVPQVFNGLWLPLGQFHKYRLHGRGS